MVLDLEMNGIQRIDEKYPVARMPGPYICTFLAGIIPISTKAAALRCQETRIAAEITQARRRFLA